MNIDTFAINYGLAAIKASTATENAGCKVCLIFCTGEVCYSAGESGNGSITVSEYDSKKESGDLVELGTINDKGNLVGGDGSATTVYVNVTSFYLDAADPNNSIFGNLVVFREAGENEDAHTIVDSYSTQLFADSLDYEISLDAENGTLNASDSLQLTITRPEDSYSDTGVFADSDKFSYVLSVYCVGGNSFVAGQEFPVDGVAVPIASVDLKKEEDDIVVSDSKSEFVPNSTYKYAVVITAYAKNDRSINSNGIVCSVASGTTDSCLKFSETYEAGELWVGDLPENMVSAQNSLSGTGGGFSEIQFGRIGSNGKYLNVVAFKGSAGAFEAWLDGLDEDCVEYVKLAQGKDIPGKLSGYNPVISGTLKLDLIQKEAELPTIDGIGISLKPGYSVTYDGALHSVGDWFDITGLDEQDDVVVSYAIKGTDNTDNYETDASVKDAGIYKIKIKLEKPGYETYISDGGSDDGYEIEIGKKELTFQEGYLIPSIDQDSTELSVPVTGVVLLGFVGNEGDYVDFQSCVCTYESSAVAGPANATITSVLTGDKATNYYVNYYVSPKAVTGTVNQIPVPGITVTQAAHPIYTGEPQEVPSFVSVTGTQDGDEVSYSLDGETFTSSVSVTDGGTYSVIVKVTREGYLPYVTALEFVVDQKALSVTILPNADIPFAYQGDEKTFDLGGGYEINGLVGNDSVEVTTAGGRYLDTSTAGTSKAIEFTFILNNGVDLANYIGVIQTTENIGTVRAKKNIQSLTPNGQPSNDNQNAATTDELVLQLSEAPDTPLTLEKIVLTAGGNYVTLDSLTADPNDPTKYTIGVTRTGTAGNGIDNVGIRINAPDFVTTAQTRPTYLVTVYWGCYGGEVQPTFAQAMGYQYGHAETVGTESFQQGNVTKNRIGVRWNVAGTGEEAGFSYVITHNSLGSITDILNSELESELGNYETFDDGENPPIYAGYITTTEEGALGSLYSVVIS